MSTNDIDSRILNIKTFVEWYRQRFSVSVIAGPKSEMSGEVFGEFYNLLFRQLVTTPFGDGAWSGLFSGSGSVYDPIVNGVLQEMERFFRSQDKGLLEQFMSLRESSISR